MTFDNDFHAPLGPLHQLENNMFTQLCDIVSPFGEPDLVFKHDQDQPASAHGLQAKGFIQGNHCLNVSIMARNDIGMFRQQIFIQPITSDDFHDNYRDAVDKRQPFLPFDHVEMERYQGMHKVVKECNLLFRDNAESPSLDFQSRQSPEYTVYRNTRVCYGTSFLNEEPHPYAYALSIDLTDSRNRVRQWRHLQSVLYGFTMDSQQMIDSYNELRCIHSISNKYAL